MARTDAELVKRTLAGDRDAFGTLVDRHRRVLFAWAQSRGLKAAEAEDLAQEVFIKAYQGLSRLDEPQAFLRWLYGIAGHVLVDMLRARTRRREETALEPGPEPLADADPGAEESLREEQRRVFRALEQLPEDQRLAVLLRYVEGLSPKEIAERLGEPRGTVRSRLHHALGSLQTALGATRVHSVLPPLPRGGRGGLAE